MIKLLRPIAGRIFFYFYSFFQISPILRFNSIKHLFPAASIVTLGIIRFKIAEEVTKILTSSSGLVSVYGSSPSGTTSDNTCFDAPNIASLSPTDASSACSIYISIRTSHVILLIVVPS